MLYGQLSDTSHMFLLPLALSPFIPFIAKSIPQCPFRKLNFFCGSNSFSSAGHGDIVDFRMNDRLASAGCLEMCIRLSHDCSQFSPQIMHVITFAYICEDFFLCVNTSQEIAAADTTNVCFVWTFNLILNEMKIVVVECSISSFRVHVIIITYHYSCAMCDVHEMCVTCACAYRTLHHSILFGWIQNSWNIKSRIIFYHRLNVTEIVMSFT